MAEVLPEKKFTCALCEGKGIQPRFLKSRCLACRGRGEKEFDGTATTCPPCQGKGRSAGALGLACLRCKGVGAVPKEKVSDLVQERLGEITKRLQWTKKETEKKTKEIERRLKPIIKEVKKETVWFQNLRDNLKKAWGALWKE